MKFNNIIQYIYWKWLFEILILLNNTHETNCYFTQVLSVGTLAPPNITYSYMTSVTNKVLWKNQGWAKCDEICNGERKSKIVCIREEDNLIVSDKRCKGLIKPLRLTERCNTDCKIRWINELLLSWKSMELNLKTIFLSYLLPAFIGLWWADVLKQNTQKWGIEIIWNL